ncbi:hypothetical protein [Motilimonas pumila]|uniref:hypothetical protein n=1 Tax=Motilimonas pumila TaxID=2303987 RepID=UPI001314DFFB|nr:hypothetical protein [Motilimonas pumila]
MNKLFLMFENGCKHSFLCLLLLVVFIWLSPWQTTQLLSPLWQGFTDYIQLLMVP